MLNGSVIDEFKPADLDEQIAHMAEVIKTRFKPDPYTPYANKGSPCSRHPATYDLD